MKNNKRREKMKKKSNKVVFVFLIFLVIIAVVVTFMVYRMVSTNMGIKDSVIVEIPQGSTVNDIAEILEENGVVDSAEHFIFLCKTKEEGSLFKYGTYEFTPDDDFYTITEKLNNGDSIDTSIHITVKEGMWLSEIAGVLAEAGLCDVDEFMAAADSRDYDYDFIDDIPERENLLEGYLYPETYHIQPGTSAYDIVDMMLAQFDKVCTENDIYDKAEEAGMSLDDIVIIASLIESEVKVEDERELVSSVIYNRLDQNMKLQIDASVIYSLGERVSRVYYSDLENENEHNTYYVTGLPVGPICSPRAASLVAAAEPADTDYIYYVVEDQETGKHYFTADYDDFLTASEKYKSTLDN